MCDDKNAPCFECIHCKKVDLSSHPDVTVLPSSEKVLVEDVEKLIDESVLVPLESTRKVYIFDKFSTANMQSQNKLLKTFAVRLNRYGLDEKMFKEEYLSIPYINSIYKVVEQKEGHSSS